MMDVLKLFDVYNRRARVFPALIATLPADALLFVLVRWNHLGLPHAITAAVASVLLFALADFGRRAGYRVQANLKSGATPEQWHRGNPDVAEGAKDRYRVFVAEKLGLKPPTAEDEQQRPNLANDFYLSAGNWLRERTRDARVFSILFDENITYGFRRNLLGLRPAALTVNLIVLAVCLTLLRVKAGYFALILGLDEKLVAVIIAAILHSSYMIFAVSSSGVREASRIYGRQLILSCETLMSQSSTAPPKKGRAKSVDG